MAIDESKLIRAHGASVAADVALSLGRLSEGVRISERERLQIADLSTRLGGFSAQRNPQWVELLQAALGIADHGDESDQLLSVLFAISHGEELPSAVVIPVWRLFQRVAQELLVPSEDSGDHRLKLSL